MVRRDKAGPLSKEGGPVGSLVAELNRYLGLRFIASACWRPICCESLAAFCRSAGTFAFAALVGGSGVVGFWLPAHPAQPKTAPNASKVHKCDKFIINWVGFMRITS